MSANEPDTDTTSNKWNLLLELFEKQIEQMALYNTECLSLFVRGDKVVILGTDLGKQYSQEKKNVSQEFEMYIRRAKAENLVLSSTTAKDIQVKDELPNVFSTLKTDLTISQGTLGDTITEKSDLYEKNGGDAVQTQPDDGNDAIDDNNDDADHDDNDAAESSSDVFKYDQGCKKTDTSVMIPTQEKAEIIVGGNGTASNNNETQPVLKRTRRKIKSKSLTEPGEESETESFSAKSKTRRSSRRAATGKSVTNGKRKYTRTYRYSCERCKEMFTSKLLLIRHGRDVHRQSGSKEKLAKKKKVPTATLR